MAAMGGFNRAQQGERTAAELLNVHGSLLMPRAALHPVRNIVPTTSAVLTAFGQPCGAY